MWRVGEVENKRDGVNGLDGMQHSCRCKEKEEVNGKALLAKLYFRRRVRLERFVFQGRDPLAKPLTACWCQHSICVCM